MIHWKMNFKILSELSEPDSAASKQIFVSQLWWAALLPQWHGAVHLAVAIASDMRVNVWCALSTARGAAINVAMLVTTLEGSAVDRRGM